jgi:hypothetical protein
MLEKFEKKIFEIEDTKFLNCTPHELRLDDGRIIPGEPELAKILTAKAIEVEIEQRLRKDFRGPGITIVTTKFLTNVEGGEFCQEAQNSGVLLIGSIIAAQAYKKPVVSPIATPETSRMPSGQRIIQTKKWNAYWE